ncbi:MAG: DUF1302 domain-containing protein [Oceanococcaceae bacterium]
MTPIPLRARAALAAVFGLSAPLAHAITLDVGPISAQIDTTLSAGVSFRMQDAAADQIGIANGGLARSVNDDDGNFGYDKGDVVSAALKGTVDLDIALPGPFGIFARGTAFYNPEASEADLLTDRLNANGGLGFSREQGTPELGPIGQERTEREGELLDLFVYGDFDVFGIPTIARFGRQVVSWGESTFIRNGINIINPINVAAIRLPGAEIKEALTPVSMLYAGMSLTNDLSVEAFWQTDWEETEIDPRGNFFSTNDFASEDGDKAVISFGRRHDDNTRPFAVLDDDPSNDGAQQVWVPREGDNRPGQEEHQAGVAFRYFAAGLNNTEFGLFYVNYHSRTPLVSAVRGAATTPGNLGTTTCSQDATAEGCRATFTVDYPEDISLYGLSLNTTAPGGIAVQGEVSYRPNQPVQLAATEILLGALVPSGSTLGAFQPGDVITGFERVAFTQAQVTLTKAMGPSFGANQWVLLGEVGYTHQDLSENLFNGPGAGLPSCNTPGGMQGVLAAVSNGSCQENVGGGYATDSSWGYRFVTRLDYNSVFGAINVSPRAIFFHDVNGVSASFNEDTKIVGLGVGFDYLNRWRADVSYTIFTGGRTYSGTDPVPGGTPLGPEPAEGEPDTRTRAPGTPDQTLDFATSANPSRDRDFLSFSVSYAF